KKKIELEYLKNMRIDKRINETSNLAKIEQHISYYAYTVTIEVSKVGVDGKVELDEKEKVKRVKQFLEVTKFLNREIRGRQENLSPLFIIDVAYPIANPFFQVRVSLDGSDQLNIDTLKGTVDSSVFDVPVKNQTRIGYVNGIFENEATFNEIAEAGTVDQFYQSLGEKVEQFYGVAK